MISIWTALCEASIDASLMRLQLSALATSPSSTVALPIKLLSLLSWFCTLARGASCCNALRGCPYCTYEALECAPVFSRIRIYRADDEIRVETFRPVVALHRRRHFLSYDRNVPRPLERLTTVCRSDPEHHAGPLRTAPQPQTSSQQG
jgi:hypothetical protein